MKRYRLQQGDLPILVEDPKGDYISLAELQEVLKGMGEYTLDLGDHVNELREMVESL